MTDVFERDDRFEFDAPKYYDFSNMPQAEALAGDDWFTHAPDGPGHRPKGGAQGPRPPPSQQQSAGR
jgi:hypothetical protein